MVNRHSGLQECPNSAEVRKASGPSTPEDETHTSPRHDSSDALDVGLRVGVDVVASVDLEPCHQRCGADRWLRCVDGDEMSRRWTVIARRWPRNPQLGVSLSCSVTQGFGRPDEHCDVRLSTAEVGPARISRVTDEDDDLVAIFDAVQVLGDPRPRWLRPEHRSCSISVDHGHRTVNAEGPRKVFLEGINGGSWQVTDLEERDHAH
jgi:hypothetical protein